MIKFKCPKCLRSLQAGDSKAGQSLYCPSCNELVTVPPLLIDTGSQGNSRTDADDLVLSILESAQESSDTRKCPFCAESIKANAIKCRFCGEVVRQLSDTTLGVSGIGEEPTIYGQSINRRNEIQSEPIGCMKTLSGIGCVWAVFLVVLVWFLIWLATGLGGLPLLVLVIVLGVVAILLKLLVR
jgi:hypothetical protein